MTRLFSKLTLLSLTVVALASVGRPSAANPTTDQLQLRSGGTTITITDNGAGDVNPILGTIASDSRTWPHKEALNGV